MFTIEELLKSADEYQRECMSLEAFERWFEDHTAIEFADEESDRIRAAVDAALAEYHFDHIGEKAFRLELANSELQQYAGNLERATENIAAYSA